MDLAKIIHELRLRRQVVVRTIAELENQACAVGPAPISKRRGRKSMGPAERLEVSKRMRRYWSDRRGKSLESQ